MRELAEALGPTAPWLTRAKDIAGSLAAAGPAGALDIQRVFQWLPPDRPAGEALFRLVEAFPRTPDRAGRRALIREHVPFLRPALLAAAAAPVVDAATGIMGGQFVHAADIAEALRRAAGAPRRFSFDMLGEGARTEADAQRGLARYAAAIAAVGAHPARARFGVSIKLSSIHPRLDAAGYARARGEVLSRLFTLCSAAAAGGVPLTIDAEESERLAMQLDLFSELARHPGLAAWDGLGLAVQAYRKDILAVIQRIAAVGEARAGRGGGRLCVRLVKGAYWDAEVKRAQELGLDDYPVHTAKPATDLAYAAAARRLLSSTAWLYPQFATHNPATLGIVLAMAELAGVGTDAFEVQRLHGMGQGVDQALARHFPAIALRVYAPVGRRPELLAYLVRRMLENGASTSYVRQAAASGDPAALIDKSFAFLSQKEEAMGMKPPRDLHMPQRRVARGRDLGDPLELEAAARELAAARRHWKAASIVDGKPLGGASRPVVSPARSAQTIGEVADARLEDVGRAVAGAHAAFPDWASTSVEARARCLERLADALEANATELMALCMAEAGKTIADALADVREAVDFCRYYAVQARQAFAPRPLVSPAGETNVLTLHGRGVFACISPWNFPVAIFTGQVAAALAAGNTVVAKPAEQSPLTACRVVELAHEAGVPAPALQLVLGGGEIGQGLVEDPAVRGVVFTGSTDTAWAIQRSLAGRRGPLVPLIAETGGLNAMIVDSTALAEQVVDAVVASAFRSAGQRCSSLRILYVEASIAPQVSAMLKGAMAALRVGDPSDPATDIGPVIDGDAQAALARYVEESRARWPVLAQAGPVPAGGHYVAPVAFEVGSIRELPGERFGPILHVARFEIDDLDRVVDDINAAGFGLTLGVHTRLHSRAERIRARAAVGNVYVNRNMIGAVVGVQPFGGEGLSGTGPKAGGPNYLQRFAVERVFTVNTAAAGGDLGLLTESA